MNKKTVIQVVVLVLLAAGGGAYFLLEQEGGIDGVLAMVGLGEAPAKTPAAPATVPKPAEPGIPAHPAKGKLLGKDFVVDAARIESGRLTLRQGKIAEVSVAGLTKNWEAPAGKKFKFSPAAAGSPMITLQRHEEGQTPTRQTLADKYTLLLEFGAEKDKKLPGKLSLSTSDGKVAFGGTFEAEIAGFRMVDGKPDLTADSTDTLAYLVLHTLLKDDPDKPLSDTSMRDMRLSVADANVPATGYLEASYRVGEAAAVTTRYQFIKDKGEWRVSGTLRADQIDEAHPPKAYGSREKPEILFPYLAAKKLEGDAHKKHPKKAIYVSEYATRYSLKHKVGECEVMYQIEGGEPTRTSFLLRDKGKGWVIDRELGKKEKLNPDTGKVDKTA